MSTLTNRERWNHYTSGLPSPQNYIDWGFRYIIAASLQRRVWLPPSHQPCFANQYAVLVGRAGLGKGLVIKEVSGFLRHWKLKDALRLNEGISDERKQRINMLHESDMDAAVKDEMQPKNRQNNIIEPLLIPMAADATTYEALVAAVAKSYRRIDHEEYCETLNKVVARPYGHSSICFSLQELGSLLRKRTDDTVNYMLGLYDCPLDYEYDTKTQGKDRVRRGCLNFFAGTTPDFMQKIFNESLIDQGFGSRTWFIYANRDRKVQFWIPELTEEQKQYKQELLEHIRKLTLLYGQIQMGPDVKEFLEEWWKEAADKRSNKSSKLDGYYSRKKVHVMKVAIAEHFMESLEMNIPLTTYKRAIEILDKEEQNMHLAITIEGTNPIAKISKKVMELLVGKRMNFVDLHVETFDCADKSQLQEALTFLTDVAGQLITEREVDETTDEEKIYWRIK